MKHRKPLGRAKMDSSKEEEAVLKLLCLELEAAKAPMLKDLEKVQNKERAMQSLKGKYRISTIRRYLGYWQHFRRWVANTSGFSVPNSVVQYVDYLYAREEEGLGASVPLAISKAVAWFERLSGKPNSEWITQEVFGEMVVRDLMQKLEGNAKPIKRAPRLLSCFIGPLEDQVVDEEQDLVVRISSWMRLVKMWASLRFDDVASLEMEAVKYYDSQLSATGVRDNRAGEEGEGAPRLHLRGGLGAEERLAGRRL